MVAFAVRLKEIRTRQGKKLTDVANSLDIKVRSYQAYEGGTREPGIAKLIALADYFDVSLDDLMGRREPPSKTGKDSSPRLE